MRPDSCSVIGKTRKSFRAFFQSLCFQLSGLVVAFVPLLPHKKEIGFLTIRRKQN